MTHLISLSSAIKGKAPIVAIPVEGNAPACVDRKRLAGWCKGVTISRIEVEQLPSVTHYDFKRPQAHPYDERGRFVGGVAEGPLERVEHIAPGARTLIIEGTAGKVKTRARFFLIDRRTAVKELAKWSEKERARLAKKLALGALDKSQRKALKLAALGDVEGSESVTVTIRFPDRTYTASGVPVTLPGFDETSFAVHRSVDRHGAVSDDHWTVTERYTGLAAGSGATAEAAIVKARSNVTSASPAATKAIHEQIATAKLAALAVAA